MKIVLDTTAIRADYHLHSPTSLTFLNGLKLIPAKLCVPEVVIDEAVNGFRTALTKALKESSEAEHEVRRLLGPSTTSSAPVAVEKRVEEYRAALVAKIASVGGDVLPYPKIEHKQLVQRDLQRRRPFRESGVGYRDALIWESVRSLTWGGHERVVFVSDNTRDFGDGPLVHEELLTDVSNPQRLTLVKSLAAVNQQLILPKMTMLESVRAELEANRVGVFDLSNWLNARLLDLLQDFNDNVAEVAVGFPQGVGSAWPSEIVELKDVKVLHVRRLSDRQLLIRIDLQFDATISISWDREDVLNCAEVRAWNGDDLDFTDASASVNVELRLGVDLVVDSAVGQVESEEVGVLGGPCNEFIFGAWDVQNEAWSEEKSWPDD